MALNTDDFIYLVEEISKASKDLNSTELVFISEWLFDFPGQSLEIADRMLHPIYNIPTGWNGYGEMGYGDTGNHNDNRNRQQPNGANRWGWQRAAMPSPLTRKIRDIQGNSYYDTTISHQNVILMRTAKGEMLTTGRGYWWSTGLSNNNQYHPMAHGLWGS